MLKNSLSLTFTMLLRLPQGMKNNLFCLFCLLITFNSFGNDTESTKRTIAWKPIQYNSVASQKVKFVYFEGASYESKNNYLPSYFERIKLKNNRSSCSVTLANPVFINCTDAEIDLVKNSALIGNEIIINTPVALDRKEAFALVSFIPLRKNKVSGTFEKLLSFELVLTETESLLKAKSVSTLAYASNSVLASGNWFKLGIANSGIYKLSYSFLQGIGMDVSTIDPRNIRIYGNGGGILPFNNVKKRYDDLVENAIVVQGENDGVFNNNDYVLFYGDGPIKWTYDSLPGDQAGWRFHHHVNLYSDSTYYFISADLGSGKRVATQSSSTQSVTDTVKAFDDYNYHENDGVNLIKSGREWFGEYFELTTSYNFSFNFPNIDNTFPVYVKTDMASRHNVTSNYKVTSQSGSKTISVAGTDVTCYFCDYVKQASGDFTFVPNLGQNISVTVSKLDAAAIGWLNYIELNVRRKNIMAGDQFLFRDAASVGLGNVTLFEIDTNFSALTLWEVTDPLNPKRQLATSFGSKNRFTLTTDTLREFIAFTGKTYLTPTSFGKVANQNLHKLAQADYIIVAHPAFLSQATQLASYHFENDNLSTVVVTPQQIYNEFSSGAQDVSAIRNFVKMFYDRTTNFTEMPQYLLLFGDGSYDNKKRFASNTNYVPTYQSDNSVAPTLSYVSDDFYGLLDDGEGEFLNDLPDIGTGRIPVKNVTEAQAALNKIFKYVSTPGFINTTASCCTEQGNTSSMGDWRNWIGFVGDDEDGSLHETQAESLASNIDNKYNSYNVDKIHLDAYVQVSTPGGQRYPDAAEAFSKRVEKGALIVNYTGHGGEVGLAHERVLENSTINNWSNINNLPLFFTATCEFSRFDDPERTSAGEYVFLNPNGGGIALMSTVRLVYASPNYFLNQNFYKYAFEEINGSMPRLGDLYRLTKNASGTDPNHRNFTLLGDPALRLAYPREHVTTTRINGKDVSANNDTLKALSPVTIEGFVRDKFGNKLTDFNGIIYPTVFDKPVNITTLSNDGTIDSPPMTFKLQKNILYKGKVSVSNGAFKFSFIVPKDIAYQFGIGRISYYAHNGVYDANGFYEDIIVGGAETTFTSDVTGPDVNLYMNDNKFVFGGTTNETPYIYALIKDSSGVNTVGNGIGHDVTAVLDENTDKVIVLNDYYEADLNSYQSGAIRYPLSKLAVGRHTLKLKVWDVYNNSSQSYTEFIVAPSAELALTHVLNYPNPFTTRTAFYFEHNQSCDVLDIQVQVFTVAGKLVKSINSTAYTEGSRSEPIYWDGKDDFGDKIGRGVYIYRVKVRSSSGAVADKFEKLVILN